MNIVRRVLAERAAATCVRSFPTVSRAISRAASIAKACVTYSFPLEIEVICTFVESMNLCLDSKIQRNSV